MEVEEMGHLAEIFSNDAGPKVLDYFLSCMYKLIVPYHIEQHTKLSHDTVKRVLAELSAKGIVIEMQVGKRKAYKLNRENEFIKSLVPAYHIEIYRKER